MPGTLVVTDQCEIERTIKRIGYFHPETVNLSVSFLFPRNLKSTRKIFKFYRADQNISSEKIETSQEKQ